MQDTDSIPSSASDFLRQVTSEEYKKAQEDLNAKIQGSYEVLTECPWVLPRKVFCLAADALETENPKSYTLRTRMDIEGAADELSKVGHAAYASWLISSWGRTCTITQSPWRREHVGVALSHHMPLACMIWTAHPSNSGCSLLTDSYFAVRSRRYSGRPSQVLARNFSSTKLLMGWLCSRMWKMLAAFRPTWSQMDICR